MTFSNLERIARCLEIFPPDESAYWVALMETEASRIRADQIAAKFGITGNIFPKTSPPDRGIHKIHLVQSSTRQVPDAIEPVKPAPG